MERKSKRKWYTSVLFCLSLLCCSVLFSILRENNAFAVTVNNANFRRAYYHAGLGYVVNNEDYGSRSLPFSILTKDTNNKQLFGVMASTNVNDTSSDKYKTISVNFGFSQTHYAGGDSSFQSVPAFLEVSVGGQTTRGLCNQTFWNDTYNGGTSFTCDVNFSNYERITAFSVSVGSLVNNEPGDNVFAATYFDNTVGDTIVASLSYTITASPDPMVVGQQTIINQNDTIINQNQTIIEQDQQDREDIEQGQEDAQEQGETAGAAASEKGQTLMQAFTSLVTALTNIHATNCILPNFSLYGMQFSNMNMCAFAMPQGIMNLASIGMVFIIVPLGISLVKRMIALYNEIVGGGK